MSVSRITEIPWDFNIDLQINLANESAAPFCRSATRDVDHYRLFLTWKTRESISWRKGISGLCRGELKGSTTNEGSHWNQKWMSRIHRWARKKKGRKEKEKEEGKGKYISHPSRNLLYFKFYFHRSEASTWKKGSSLVGKRGVPRIQKETS